MYRIDLSHLVQPRHNKKQVEYVTDEESTDSDGSIGKNDGKKKKHLQMSISIE